MATVSDSVWSASDTSPAEIADALANLIVERHSENACFVPARVLNMVCIVDREWSGEIANRLRRVGRYHASRTVICSISPGRKQIAATATVSSDVEPQEGEFAVLRENVIVEIGPQHIDSLDTIVDPLVVTDLATVLWAPHGHSEALDSLLGLAQVVLIDSVDEPDPADALRRACALSDRVYVVDLAWLRSTPWRERIAATFDPPQQRPQLDKITRLAIRHHPASTASALLLTGWFASRLGWKTSQLERRNGGLAGTLHTPGGEVGVALENASQDTPGLAGITLETADGMRLSLDRGPGGLHATRVAPDGAETSWTVIGASRGEGGILGEGIRQALLRDPSYTPALSVAGELAG